LFVSYFGIILTSLVENLTMFNFMFFVDKFKLEFKVIKKDVTVVKKDRDDLKANVKNIEMNNNSN
jgi:hypothetical protein